MRNIALIAAVIVIISPAQIRAGGIDSLVEVGKSMADINAAMDEETRAFNRVKEAIDTGIIKKGISEAEVRSRCGEPVIANDDSATKREKWVYKPATSSFFKGIRIYLFFDDTGALDEIRTLQ
ncbi:MAG: hypothetical protein NTY76_07775 [Candidatus Omnitrophica bacterium]|nr:hypothetical protein [Candidatus Omnitrophota bacterium]